MNMNMNVGTSAANAGAMVAESVQSADVVALSSPASTAAALCNDVNATTTTNTSTALYTSSTVGERVVDLLSNTVLLQLIARQHHATPCSISTEQTTTSATAIVNPASAAAAADCRQSTTVKTHSATTTRYQWGRLDLLQAGHETIKN